MKKKMARRTYNPIREEWRIESNPEGRMWKINPHYKPDIDEFMKTLKPTVTE